MFSPPHPRLQPWLPVIAIVTLSLIWGYTWVIAKQALAFAPPFALAAERTVLSALVMLVVMRLAGRPMRLVAPRLTIANGLTMTGFITLQTWALVEGGPGKTSVLIFTMPIWTLLLAWPLLGERVRGAQWLAAASTLGGLLLIIQPWDMHTSLLSKLLGLGAALCWATGTILIKRIRMEHSADLLALTTWQLTVGAVPLVVFALLIPEPETRWGLHYVALLAFMAIGSTGIGWLLWIYILDRVPAWEASLSVLGTPVIALISSRLVLGEGFDPLELAGILLIGAGLLLLSLLGWLATRRAAAVLARTDGG